MSHTITAGLRSLILEVDWPLEEDGVTPRDDLVGMIVWMSETSGFTPVDSNRVFDGPGLKATMDNLTAGTTYYLRYALVSEIDPLDYVISDQISGTPTRINTGNQGLYIESLSAEIIKAGMIRGRAVASLGSRLYSPADAGATTISLESVDDFPNSGYAFIVAMNVWNDSDFGGVLRFSYTGRNTVTNQLTGCSGIAVTNGQPIAVDSAVVPADECFVFEPATGQLRLFGDPVGAGAKSDYRQVGAIGIGTPGMAGGSDTVAMVGRKIGSLLAMLGQTGSGVGLWGISHGTGNGTGVRAQAENGGVALHIVPQYSPPTAGAWNELVGGEVWSSGAYIQHYNGATWQTLQTRGTHYFSEVGASNEDSMSYDDSTDIVSFNADGGVGTASVAAKTYTTRSGSVRMCAAADTESAAVVGGGAVDTDAGGSMQLYGRQHASTSLRGAAMLRSAAKNSSGSSISQSWVHVKSMDAATESGSILCYTNNTLALEIDSAARLRSTSTLAAGTASGTALVIESTTGRISRTSSSMRTKRAVEPADIDMLADIGERLSGKLIYYRSAWPDDNQDWSHWGLPAEGVAEIDPRFVAFGYPLKKVFDPGIPASPDVVDDFGDLVASAREAEPGSVRIEPDTSKPMRPESLYYDRMVVPLFALDVRRRRQISEIESRLAELEEIINELKG